MLVIAPQLALYMALAPEEKLTYKEGGPAALANFEAGAEGFTTRSFRGCGAVTSDPFEVSDESEAVQMLQRFTQVGEFYVMSKPAFGLKVGMKGFMDIMIYDEEKDKQVLIPFRDACIATGLLMADGGVKVKVGTDPAVAAHADGQTMAGAVVFDAAYVAKVNALVCANLGRKADDTAAIDQAEIDALEDCPVLLARPFIEHAMLSAILTVSGQDTGATLFGPSDMQISANTSVKTIEGHYTGHFKSVITKPQNVFVMKDIMSNGYRAGCNTAFFDDAQQVMDRLNMEDMEMDTEHKSLMAFLVTPKQLEKLQTEISITSRLLPYDVHAKTQDYFPGGPGMFAYYNAKYGLDSVHFGEALRASENMEYMSQGSVNNALCFTGPYRKFDPITTAAYVDLSPGMGHWGPDARPGDARWRRGESVSMMSAREAMLSYEQLQYIPKPKI